MKSKKSPDQLRKLFPISRLIPEAAFTVLLFDGEIAAAVVGRAVENQQDILPGKSSRQNIEETLEACGVRSRHDQIDACPSSGLTAPYK
jgi:hypothetical protein